MSRCSICYTVLAEGEAVTGCPDCHTDYHATCWNEIGGCGSYGCKQAAVAQKPPVPVLVGAGWGDSKECPACARSIGSSLLVCACSARFPWADPMTPPEYLAHLEQQRSLKTSRTVLLWMFILSLVGVTAPVVGPIAGFYAYRKRKQLLGTGGTYLAIGYGSAAIGGLYSLLLILIGLGH
jgi:Prokaryotic RING finger family 1